MSRFMNGNPKEGPTTAYCVKCKEKKEIQNPEEVTMKNGRSALKGKCAVCGTGMFRILGIKKD